MEIKKFIDKKYQTNSYLLIKNKDAVVIDPGYNSEEIVKFLTFNHLDLKMILFTHGHYDHIGDYYKITDKYKVDCFLDFADFTLITSTKRGGCWFKDFDPAIKCDLELPFNIQAIEAKGHTLGSTIFLLEEEKILFTGDVIFNGDIGRVDLYNSAGDKMVETLKKINSFKYNYRIYPGHGSDTYLDHQRAMITLEIKDYK